MLHFRRLLTLIRGFHAFLKKKKKPLNAWRTARVPKGGDVKQKTRLPSPSYYTKGSNHPPNLLSTIFFPALNLLYFVFSQIFFTLIRDSRLRKDYPQLPESQFTRAQCLPQRRRDECSHMTRMVVLEKIKIHLRLQTLKNLRLKRGRKRLARLGKLDWRRRRRVLKRAASRAT
jgi:hypothetical protein